MGGDEVVKKRRFGSFFLLLFLLLRPACGVEWKKCGFGQLVNRVWEDMTVSSPHVASGIIWVWPALFSSFLFFSFAWL